jgi:hypothetical protein
VAGSEEPSGVTAGGAYGQLIADQLAEERDRKTSLESRGITVITTSGSLAAVLFGLITILASAAHFRLPGSIRLPVVLAVVALVIAGLLGLATNIPLRYKEPTTTALARLLHSNYWTGPGEIGQLRVAQVQVRTIAAARKANGLKVALLVGAMLCELLAVIFLAWAIAGIVYTG